MARGKGQLVRWYKTRNGGHFYAVAEPIEGDRPDAVCVIRKGRAERISLGRGVIFELVECTYNDVPTVDRQAFHDWFWPPKR